MPRTSPCYTPTTVQQASVGDVVLTTFETKDLLEPCLVIANHTNSTAPYGLFRFTSALRVRLIPEKQIYCYRLEDDWRFRLTPQLPKEFSSDIWHVDSSNILLTPEGLFFISRLDAAHGMVDSSPILIDVTSSCVRDNATILSALNICHYAKFEFQYRPSQTENWQSLT